jgi:cob(I)alamin adenosyltransferase
MPEKTNTGLIQVYTGDGKGKTTAALGLAVRASGQGMRVCFIQFLKGEPGGEHMFVSRYHPFDIVQTGIGSSFTKSKEELNKDAQQTLSFAEEKVLSDMYDLIILDEILVAVHKGLISTEQVLDLLDKKPDTMEIVLTGRYEVPEILQRADLVTEMRMIKHPFKQGIRARPGIEY